MTTIHRFPVLIWRDAAGQFTARVAVDDGVAAVGRSRAIARDQLGDYLDWVFRRESWRSGPDCHDAELKVVKVAVRAEYRHEKRRYPCHEPVVLRVPCVVSRPKTRRC